MEHTFTWASSAPDKVVVTGSFDDWKSSLELEKEESGKFHKSTTLPWGKKVHYKYVVDGVWQVNTQEKTEDDGQGNLNNVIDVPTQADVKEHAKDEIKEQRQEKREQDEIPDVVGGVAAGVAGLAGVAAAAAAGGAAAVTHAIHPDEEDNKDKAPSKSKKKNNKKKNKGKAKETEESDVTKDPVLGAPVNNTETPDTKQGEALVPGEKPADPASSPVLEKSSPEVKSAEGKSISTVPDGTRVAMAARMPSDVEIAKDMPNSSLRTEQPVPPSSSSAAQEVDGPADGGKVVAAAVETESKDHTTGDSVAPALTPDLQGDPQLPKHTGAKEEVRSDVNKDESEDKGPLAAAAGLAGASGIAGLAGAAYVLKNDTDDKKPEEEEAQKATPEEDKEPAPKPEEVSEAAKAPADKGKVVAATVQDEADTTKPLSETTTAPPLSSEAKQQVPEHTGAAVERRDDHSASPEAAGPLETDATAPAVAGAAGVVGGGAGVYAAKESGSTPAKTETPSAAQAQEPSSELQQHTGAVAERRDDVAPSDAQPGPVQDDATRTAVPDKAGEKQQETSSVPAAAAAAAAGAGGVGAAAAAAGKHEAPAGVAEAPKSDVVWDPTLAPEAHKTVATGQPPAQSAASQAPPSSSAVPKEAQSKAAQAPATPKKDAPAPKEAAPQTPAPSAQQQKQEQLQPDSAKSTPGQYSTAPSTPQGTPIKDKRKSGLFSKIKSALSPKKAPQ